MLQRLRAVEVSTIAMACLLAVALSVLAPAAAGAQIVERVVDGDTIVVRGVGRVRLIGVDTPETVHPSRPVEFFGREASAFAKRLLQGQRVRLEYDREPTDRYGRTLAYVHLADGTFVNAEIIRRGYGHAYTRFPFRHLDRFRQLEREAREAGRGLWGRAGAPARPAAALRSRSGAAASAIRWDDNGNGRVSCAEARRHGIAPVPRSHPAYAYMRDGDGDGVVCE
jgi:micrococcal nuclease